MLTYSFTNIGSESLYLHLYKCIKNDIIARTLAPGYKLPSKRSFAKNLGISVITVENAYAQLISEGYIYSIAKKGFFVADINVFSGNPEQKITIENVNMTSGDTGIPIDLASNQTKSDNFPFSIWAKLVREILNDNQEDLMTNPPCGGIKDLRVAIAKHLKEYRDIKVDPKQIIIGAGTEYLYSLLVQLIGFDKEYAIEDPGYQKIARVYKKHNVACHHIPMDENGVSISKLEESGADVLHISPAHHFPTGIITPISRRYELLGWVSKSDNRYIIEDDYDSEFRMIGKPIPSLLNIDLSEKVIYMNTFNKSLSSTVRISYMVLPVHLVNRFYSELSFYSCTVSNFEQYTLAKFIMDGYFEKHINRMRSFYHTKRDSFIEKIKSSKLSSYVKIHEEDSGLHFILEINTAMSDNEFCESALRKGLRITALSNFYVNPVADSLHKFVVNYSAIEDEDMDKAIKILTSLV